MKSRFSLNHSPHTSSTFCFRHAISGGALMLFLFLCLPQIVSCRGQTPHDTAAVDTAMPDSITVSLPKTSDTEPSDIESTAPDTSAPDTSAPDISVPDTSKLETSEPEISETNASDRKKTTPIEAITTAADTETGDLPVQPDSRIRIPKLRGMTLAEAQSLLIESGLTYEVTEEYSAQAAAGTVLRAQFWGKVEEDCYRVNGEHPIVLTVSKKNHQKSNVTAVDEKRIYLTFDDGPCQGTDTVLDILEEYGIHATFFTLGTYANIYPERIRAIRDGGHLLGCHSYSHDYESLYASADAALTEIAQWKETVEKALGESVNDDIVFRFPGGTTTYYLDDNRFEEIFWAITDAGYRSFDWTFADNDRYLKGKPEDQPIEEFLKASTLSSLKNCAAAPAWPKIMLMHDTSQETISILPWIIETLQEEGYTFGTLDELDGYWIAHK